MLNFVCDRLVSQFRLVHVPESAHISSVFDILQQSFASSYQICAVCCLSDSINNHLAREYVKRLKQTFLWVHRYIHLVSYLSRNSSPFSSLRCTYQSACTALHMNALHVQRFSPLRDIIWCQPQKKQQLHSLLQHRSDDWWKVWKYDINNIIMTMVLFSVRITLRPSKAMAVDALWLGLDALYFYGIL